MWDVKMGGKSFVRWLELNLKSQKYHKFRILKNRIISFYSFHVWKIYNRITYKNALINPLNTLLPSKPGMGIILKAKKNIFSFAINPIVV